MHSRKKPARPISDAKLAELLDYFEAKRARREASELLFLVKPSGLAISHLAAYDLKRYKHWIYRAAEEGRTEFFVDLGKLLEGKRLKPNTWSKLDEDVAFIFCLNPKIKSTEAVELLTKLNHPLCRHSLSNRRNTIGNAPRRKRVNAWKNSAGSTTAIVFSMAAQRNALDTGSRFL